MKAKNSMPARMCHTHPIVAYVMMVIRFVVMAVNDGKKSRRQKETPRNWITSHGPKAPRTSTRNRSSDSKNAGRADMQRKKEKKSAKAALR